MDTELKERLRACAAVAGPVFDALEAQNYQAWLVGGCVRDILIGEKPKDIDLATDAPPEKAAEAYRIAGLKTFETGLQHGTLTVLAGGEGLEVTTLRTETGHDGRHADVAWTTSLQEDLMRRDLTINAMAATRDGELIDPFGGKADLLDQRRVRFVGNANERVEEDYLRILRFFRFHARFAGDQPLDPVATEAIAKGAPGLAKISVERVWSEMSKVMVHPQGATMLTKMNGLGLFDAMPIPFGNMDRLQKAIDAKVTNPALAMGFMLDAGSDAPAVKWSSEEAKAFKLANERHSYDLTRAKYDLVKDVPLDHVEQVARFNDFAMPAWDVPTLPVAGKDLIKNGMKPGPEMGQMLARLEKLWVQSDYQKTQEQLLAVAKEPVVDASHAMHARQAMMGQGR
jgi:tRNA nucleotidyltransferase/poly(A) polymerase